MLPLLFISLLLLGVHSSVSPPDEEGNWVANEGSSDAGGRVETTTGDGSASSVVKKKDEIKKKQKLRDANGLEIRKLNKNYHKLAEDYSFQAPYRVHQPVAAAAAADGKEEEKNASSVAGSLLPPPMCLVCNMRTAESVREKYIFFHFVFCF